MSGNFVYLITGANRGIGKGLVSHYLASPHTTVIATVRDPAHETAQSLHQLSRGEGSELIVTRLDAESNESIHEAIDQLVTSKRIEAIDFVISNAGVGEVIGPLAETPVDIIKKYVQVNAYAPLELFKATLPLLSKAAHPKFVVITSIVGSFQLMDTTLPSAAYGASKAIANFFVKWLSQENKNIVMWAQHPGFVDTDIAQSALEGFAKLGVDTASLQAVSVEKATKMITEVVANSTYENSHGKFLGPDGSEIPW